MLLLYSQSMITCLCRYATCMNQSRNCPLFLLHTTFADPLLHCLVTCTLVSVSHIFQLAPSRANLTLVPPHNPHISRWCSQRAVISTHNHEIRRGPQRLLLPTARRKDVADDCQGLGSDCGQRGRGGAGGKEIAAIVGTIRLLASQYIIVASKTETVGAIFGQQVHRVTAFDILPINGGSADPRSSSTSRFCSSTSTARDCTSAEPGTSPRHCRPRATPSGPRSVVRDR